MTWWSEASVLWLKPVVVLLDCSFYNTMSWNRGIVKNASVDWNKLAYSFLSKLCLNTTILILIFLHMYYTYFRYPNSNSTGTNAIAISPVDSSLLTIDTVINPFDKDDVIDLCSLSGSHEWELHNIIDNMTVYRKAVHGTSLSAFKGETIVPYHINQMVDFFLDVNLTLRWAGDLKEIEVFPYSTENLNENCVDNSTIASLSTFSSQGDKGLPKPDLVSTIKSKPKKTLKEKLFFWKREKDFSNKESGSGPTIRQLDLHEDKNPLSETTSSYEDSNHSLKFRNVSFDQKYIWNKLVHFYPQRASNQTFSTMVNPVSACNMNLKKGWQLRDNMRQVYSKFPLSPREFIFQRDFSVDDSSQTFIALYRTIEDHIRFPVHPKMIRTKSPFTIWKFQSLSSYCDEHDPMLHNNNDIDSFQKTYESKLSSASLARLKDLKSKKIPTDFCLGERKDYTYLELQTFVNLEDMGFSWLINYIQSSWPTLTVQAISKVMTETKEQRKVHPRFSSWS